MEDYKQLLLQQGVGAPACHIRLSWFSQCVLHCSLSLCLLWGGGPCSSFLYSFISVIFCQCTSSMLSHGLLFCVPSK
jgi:hypothetical protein